jgi:hypothetical protein
MAFTETVWSFYAQGKMIPMVSGKDLVKLFTRLKQREKAEGIVRRIKPVAVAQLGVDANAAGGAAGCTVPNRAVVDGGIAHVATSPQMMPPPKFTVAASKYNAMISKKLFEITEFPEFSIKSHLSVQFRQRDEKVSAPDLLVVSGKYKLVSEAHDAMLKMIEIKDAVLNDLDSLEIDDNLIMLRGKSVILMAFPDAIELLHRLGVCTIDKDDIVPPIEAEVVVASDVIHQVQVSVASGVAMCAASGAARSDAAQNVNMPPIAVPVMSPSIAAKIRTRTVPVPASVLKTISGFENLDDSCLEGKEVRQVEPGQVDEKGEDISGKWVIPDGVSACTGDSAQNCAKWVKNPKNVNKEIAKSLSYIDTGHSSVSLLS